MKDHRNKQRVYPFLYPPGKVSYQTQESASRANFSRQVVPISLSSMICALLWLLMPSMSISVHAQQIEEAPIQERTGQVDQLVRAIDIQEHPLLQNGDQRIIGGEEAEVGAWPWAVALVREVYGEERQFCGGSLIAPEWVLTAAHCVHWRDPSTFHAILGRHQLSTTDGERLAVERVVLHPHYAYRTLDSDIALIKLATPSEQTSLMPLTPEQQELATSDVIATVIGWGVTVNSIWASGSDVLRQVSLPIVSNEICNAAEAYDGDVTDNMLCVGQAEGGKSSCYGDSGGPLMVPTDDDSGWLQAGIVSWGEGCARPNKYGVYTRVSTFQPWITACMADPDSTDCQFLGIPQTEYDALVALYQNTDGENWDNNLNWLTTAAPCSWYGVICEAGHVTELNFYWNGLRGTIPKEIGDLVNLEYLDLYANSLSGQLPITLGNLKNLAQLYLSFNQLAGPIPSELGNLVNLNRLGMGSNQLTGTIPIEIGNLVNLEYLGLYYNELTGTIPIEIGSLVNLEYLYLDNNELTGTIPAEIGNLLNLQNLDLSSNQLSGPIPNELSNLTNLWGLYLYNNQLSGAIPGNLGQLNSLYYLSLHSNLLSGELPSELGDLHNLEKLYLHNTLLVGPIPDTFAELKDLRLFHFQDTELCVPENMVLQTWLANISSVKSTFLTCADRPTLYIPANQPAPGEGQITMPIGFRSGEDAISSLTFSVDYDEECLSLETAFSRLPDDFEHVIQTDLSDSDREVAISIYDPSAPLATLLDGTIATLTFNVTCTPVEDETIIAPIVFANDPVASFGDTNGQDVVGQTEDGSVEIHPFGTQASPGDCNGDNGVDVADILCLTLELFDGDGNAAQDTEGGTYVGTSGADANRDSYVNASDYGCISLIIFSNGSVCSSQTGLARSASLPSGQSGAEELPMSARPALTLQASSVIDQAGKVPVSLRFDARDHAIAGMAFALAYDAQQLTFDPSDQNGDGQPDTVQFDLPDAFALQIDSRVEHGVGILHVLITTSELPLAALPNGPVMTIEFDANEGHASDETSIQFAESPAASFGDDQGQSVPTALYVEEEVEFDELYFPLIWN